MNYKLIKREVIFFVLAFLGCTGAVYAMSWALREEVTLTTYSQTMMVIMLVTYLTRVIFMITKNLK
ncbi:hypothetical protein [Sediminitomix flava]|uniref:Lipoprotein n=1 Tax=Sediminitomix flava TaxID=379075 RepID=A0A315Z6A4_SEDFL|nr:hypothetical protein [Sediminitomix flava]PWJ39383.1 hypothetical protein BC781_106284 [Sediminitomix flava]